MVWPITSATEHQGGRMLRRYYHRSQSAIPFRRVVGGWSAIQK